MQEIERFVDLLERQIVRDEIVDIDLAVHVTLDIAGQLGAALHAAKGGTTPDATGDQLERPGGDLLSGRSNTDDAGGQ